MKKSILFVLLLLFSCISDDDIVSPPEQPPKDTVDTVKTDTTSQTPLTSKEMADTIIVVELFKGKEWGDNKDSIFYSLDADTVDAMGFTLRETFCLSRSKELISANDTVVIKFGNLIGGSIQDTAIVLKNDSWLYSIYPTGSIPDTPTANVLILDAITLEIQIFGDYYVDPPQFGDYYNRPAHYEFKNYFDFEQIFAPFEE